MPWTLTTHTDPAITHPHDRVPTTNRFHTATGRLRDSHHIARRNQPAASPRPLGTSQRKKNVATSALASRFGQAVSQSNGAAQLLESTAATWSRAGT